MEEGNKNVQQSHFNPKIHRMLTDKTSYHKQSGEGGGGHVERLMNESGSGSRVTPLISHSHTGGFTV